MNGSRILTGRTYFHRDFQGPFGIGRAGPEKKRGNADKLQVKQRCLQPFCASSGEVYHSAGIAPASFFPLHLQQQARVYEKADFMRTWSNHFQCRYHLLSRAFLPLFTHLPDFFIRAELPESLDRFAELRLQLFYRGKIFIGFGVKKSAASSGDPCSLPSFLL